MKRNEIKNVLLISHEMSRTGAPVALQYMANQFKEEGVFVVVLSPKDGPMAQEMLRDDILVIIDETMLGNDRWLKMASNFDLIVVCTVVLYSNILQLEKVNIPVIWWTHDGEMSFQLGGNKLLPLKISSNVFVYAGGNYAKKIMDKYRPLYGTKELLYCVPDRREELLNREKPSYMIKNDDKKVVISNIGSIDKRKGQDILVVAIRKLSQDDIMKCLFVFVGKNNNEYVYKEVLKLKKDYPKNVLLIEEVSREEVQDIYKQSNVVVCTSRDDPMPVFLTESLMLSIPIICSDNTGTFSLIEDNVSGFSYHNNNVEELKNKLVYVIYNREKLDYIGKNGRFVYEKKFTKEAFKRQLDDVIDEILL